MEITKDKVTELFCIIDEFCKVFEAENAGKLLLGEDGVRHRRRKASLSDSEIMTILLYFHFGSFRNFKHYYLFFVSDKEPKVFEVLSKRLYDKLFADKGYISQKLFDYLFEDGIQLVTGQRVNMKNKLMPFYDRMMLRKRYIIETINDLLKNTAQIVHSRHRSVANFIMNLISALGAYCFFENKPKALTGYAIEDTKQLSLF